MKNKYLSLLLSCVRIPDISNPYKEEYRLYKFNTNNTRMVIVAWVLVFEQFILGVTVADPGSGLRIVYFLSSIIMLCFAISGVIFIEKRLVKVTVLHEIFIMSFACIGMAVALGRFLVIEESVLQVPTIYIAVLYGVAVIFVFNKWQGFYLYTAITLCTVICLPVFHPEIKLTNYHSDIITNGIIAAVILMMNTKRHINSFNDKKKIEAINKELREQSIRDGLTGLYNRRKLDDVLGEVCLKADRYDSDFSVIMIDLDHFKRINDNNGHHIGDSVLVDFSRILENNIREVDVCGRWGGEEFLVICQETSITAAYQLAERLRENVEVADFTDGLKITASFGVSSWNGCTDEAMLLKDVDKNLYRAKTRGRNRVCTSDADAKLIKSDTDPDVL